MYKDGENIFYYITVMNEPYAMPAMPAGAKEGILKGMYKLRPAAKRKAKLRAQLFGSGAILNEVLRAQEILEPEVRRCRRCLERHQLQESLHRRHRSRTLEPPPSRRNAARPLRHASASKASRASLVAASDYLKVLPSMISKWVPRRLATLGTDGFGRSEGRDSLREFFEVDSRFITLATLHELFMDGKMERSVLDKAIKDLGINTEKPNPVVS